MRERVLLTLFLIIFCLPQAFAKVDYSGINLQVDAFEKQEVLDIGNPVIRIEKLNGQQPIKKNKFNITTETKENAAAKSAIPFDYDKREFLKINEPIENFGFFSKKYQNADFEESIKSSPRFSGDITTLSTDEEAAVEEENLEGGVSKDEGSAKVAKKQRNYDKAKAFWEWFKGEPAYDALLLGMWSWHVNYDHDVNGTNDLLGMQYAGYLLGTFRNSYSQRSYMAGVARRVWSKTIYKDFGVDFQYKAGIFKGYGDKYPNVGGWTPIILPIVGFNYKTSGVDMWIIPSDRPILVWNLRFALPMKYQYINKDQWGKTVYNEDGLSDNYIGRN